MSKRKPQFHEIVVAVYRIRGDCNAGDVCQIIDRKRSAILGYNVKTKRLSDGAVIDWAHEDYYQLDPFLNAVRKRRHD